MSKAATQKETKFKDFNKKLNRISVPVIMKDFHRIEELTKFKAATKDVFIETEIEDYIALLQEFCGEFKEQISNNLKAKELSQNKVDECLLQMIENTVVVGDATPRITPTDLVYNCHGWSCGFAKWLELDRITPATFIDQLIVTKKQTLLIYSAYITDNKHTFFSSDNMSLKYSEHPINKDGSIAAYYDKGILTHTARYVNNIDWYKYQEGLHKDWYVKDKSLVRFHENGDCIVENFTSKIGMGYLVIHKLQDIMPLYGENIEFYDVG